MIFSTVNRLEAWRTMSDGQQIQVGVLAQNRAGIFFQYHTDYLSTYANLSPFKLEWNASVQPAPAEPHDGLSGTFADSLPDGWGLLLMDRVFRQHGLFPGQITALDRLAFVGERAMGALSYLPHSSYKETYHEGELDLHELGLQAQAIFDGQTDDVLGALVAAGSSGGARPKAQLYFSDDDFLHCRAIARPGDEAWLVKFTSGHLALGHEEGLCEAAYLTMAARAGLAVPDWQLLPAPAASGARYWLGLKRFDWVSGSERNGRLHIHSACGLLGADFRQPSLDYADLIRASSVLCQSPSAGQIQFRRALFNLFSLNQDDHSKNWSFLQDDQGNWSLAPFYDVTFSPHPFGEHATAFNGYGKNPPLKAIQKLAAEASFASWHEARQCIEEIVDAIAHFPQVAKQLEIKAPTIKLIEQQLKTVRSSNQALYKTA